MSADQSLHTRVQDTETALTLPPEGWEFTKQADNLFELQPTNAGEDDERLFHVTEDPMFSPGNVVAQYYNTDGDRDKIDWPKDDLNEIARFIQMKFDLPENQ